MVPWYHLAWMLTVSSVLMILFVWWVERNNPDGFA